MLPYSYSQIIQSADQLSVSNDAIVGLLKGAAEVLSRMPHEQITVGMRGLCQMQTAALVQVSGCEVKGHAIIVHKGRSLGTRLECECT